MIEEVATPQAANNIAREKCLVLPFIPASGVRDDLVNPISGINPYISPCKPPREDKFELGVGECIRVIDQAFVNQTIGD